jgi:hypothetical protein
MVYSYLVASETDCLTLGSVLLHASGCYGLFYSPKTNGTCLIVQGNSKQSTFVSICKEVHICLDNEILGRLWLWWWVTLYRIEG